MASIWASTSWIFLETPPTTPLPRNTFDQLGSLFIARQAKAQLHCFTDVEKSSKGDLKMRVTYNFPCIPFIASAACFMAFIVSALRLAVSRASTCHVLVDVIEQKRGLYRGKYRSRSGGGEGKNGGGWPSECAVVGR